MKVGEVGRRNAMMEYLHEVALARIGFANLVTQQHRDAPFPNHTHVKSQHVPHMLKEIVRFWTKALDAWKAYEAECQSLYGVEEPAA